MFQFAHARHRGGILRASVALWTLWALVPAQLRAQEATELPPVSLEPAADLTVPLSSTVRTGGDLDAARAATSDTARLIEGVPGAALASGGGFSSLPVLHGMADDRVRTLLDGVPITSTCPNHMNPALSYTMPAVVDRVTVMAGITPVSAGGDSIGGTIAVDPADPVFAGADEDVAVHGSLSAFYRSNAHVIGGAATLSVANDWASLGYAGSWVRARDYHDGDGDVVRSSMFENGTHEVTAAFRNDTSRLVVRAGQEFSPYEGFPNVRMDLTGNRGNHVNAHYQGDFNWGQIDARAYWQDVTHAMNFIYYDKTGNMPMYAEGKDLGYAVKADIPVSDRDRIRIGNEIHRYVENDWWPATTKTSGMMGPNTFISLNEATKDQIGTFAEWERHWDPRWTTLAGVRNDTIMMNTGNVQGYTASIYGADAASFNGQKHAKTDVDFDATLLTRFEPDATTTEELGFARKTRSPNFYERYAWSKTAMAAGMINWAGDVNGYVGNLNLKPETAYTASFTSGWHDRDRTDWEVKVTPYFTYVANYITVTQVGTIASGTLPLLQFVNHDAELYGADLSGKTVLWRDEAWGRFGLSGVLGWVRGFQLNDGGSLYHMMPLNGRLALDHSLGGWSSAIEVQAVDHKSEADALRKEPYTPGYALVNLRTSYAWSNLRVDLGIDNLFDKQYYLPLGGVDYADQRFNSGMTHDFQALPGPGRSFNLGVTVSF
jgi:iron complex outermembrane recepter protein